MAAKWQSPSKFLRELLYFCSSSSGYKTPHIGQQVSLTYRTCLSQPWCQCNHWTSQQKQWQRSSLFLLCNQQCSRLQRQNTPTDVVVLRRSFAHIKFHHVLKPRFSSSGKVPLQWHLFNEINTVIEHYRLKLDETQKSTNNQKRWVIQEIYNLSFKWRHYL